MARPKITPKKSDSQTKRAAKIQRERKMAQGVKPAHPDGSAASENEETDNDDEGSAVDEGGLEKLMKALGGDGLDEFDLAQLRMLSGSAEREEGSGEGGEEDSSDGEEDDEDTKSVSDEEHAIGEEEAIALDDEEVHSVDEDAVPRRKIEVDNKVRPRPAPRLPSRLIS
jgi:rRNA-processing protein EBP2